MTYQCTEKKFLKDVAEHKMEIIRDDGVNRHVRFKAPSTYNMHFDLVTWPGYLCYTGDMGTYVFKRTEDMFCFFRTDKGDFNFNRNGGLSVNRGYWGEKLESIDRSSGYKEYSEEKFKSIVNETVDEYIEENGWAVAGTNAIELRDAVFQDVLCCAETDHDAWEAARDFNHEGFQFHDFWEHDLTDYTFHFIWCCYALAWGIEQYDKQKEQVPA